MSYILEALRRSQAERERGRVPGLDAQLATSHEAAKTPRPAVAGVWLGVGAGAAVLVFMAGVAWRVSSPASSPASAIATGPAPPAAPAPLAVPPAAVEAAAVSAPSPALPVVVSAPVVAPPAVSPSAVASPTAALPVPSPTSRTPAPDATATAEPRAVPLAELSAEQRRELPPMAIGGSIWSENAASRFVMVNGQVVHEGEPAAPGVTVERIGPKAAVMRWRDLRVELPF